MKTKKKVVDEFNQEHINNYIATENTHFRCVLRKVSELKEMFETLKEALKNTTIKFIKPSDPDNPDSGGMTINAFDKRTRALIKSKTYCMAFEDYYIEDNEYSIGVDIKKFATKIKQASNNDTIIMYLDKDKTDELYFVFWNPSGFHDKQKLKLMNIPEDVITIPESQFDCMLNIKSEIFHQYIKNSSSSTDKIAISFIDTKERPNTIIFSDPKPYNGGSERVLSDKTEGVTITKTNKKDTEIIIRNVYKIKNLIIFCKMKTPYVSLFLTSKYPLIVNYNMEEFGYLVLILPPDPSDVDKIADDDEDDIDKDDEDEDEDEDDEVEGIKNLCIEEEEEEEEEDEEEYV